ncbi:MAG: ATP-binding protein [Leptolyngbya sp. IPPAS B-1204]|nr:MAG: hybrid sensor histidine kinase/response regulator [Leptolyngbya sp. IPPAS B-1204]
MVSKHDLAADAHKTREQLLSELAILRQHVVELEQGIADLTQSPHPKLNQGNRELADLSTWRISLLQQLMASLAGALTTAEIVDILLHQGLIALKAVRGWVAQRSADPETIEIIKMIGCSPAEMETYRSVRLSQATPATDSIRTGQMVLVRSLEEYRQHYPDLIEQFMASGSQSLVSLPLVINGQVMGSLGWSFAQPQEFDEGDCDFMMTLARQCAQALERAQLYEAERLARETAEAANRVKDEFLAVLSHELRSPLNPILGWTKMLRSRQFDAQMTNRALEAIERNARLQVQLIEDLLDISHILQGKLRLNISVVDLRTVIEAALESVRLAAESKSIHLRFLSEAPTALCVAGDAVRLQQIIWNLISNAVKFTPSGGEVEVRLEQVGKGEGGEGDREAVSSALASAPAPATVSPSCYAQIAVIDTGRGIDPVFLPYIFDYFRQADSTITRQFGGLGLGLTIVRHLVELHGGTIQAESQGEGQGATFRVWLPLLQSTRRASTVRQPIPSTAVAQRLNQVRILVVDDDADMREYVEAVLQMAGAQVVLAGSAGEALAKLPRFQPHVLISDIGLPNVDGYRLLRQIRTLVPELGGQVPAIALTAYAGEYNQQQVLASGFQLHIAKPVEPEMLVAAIANLLANPAPVPTLASDPSTASQANRP